MATMRNKDNVSTYKMATMRNKYNVSTYRKRRSVAYCIFHLPEERERKPRMKLPINNYPKNIYFNIFFRQSNISHSLQAVTYMRATCVNSHLTQLSNIASSCYSLISKSIFNHDHPFSLTDKRLDLNYQSICFLNAFLQLYDSSWRRERLF
jgi:hypothetical protein